MPASAEAVAIAQMFHTAFSRCKISSTEKPSGPERGQAQDHRPDPALVVRDAAQGRLAVRCLHHLKLFFKGLRTCPR